MKVCTKCKEETDNFSPSSLFYCRKCVSAITKANREGPNRQKILEGKKQYYQENREKCDAAIQRWKEENKEKALSYHSVWAKRNPAVVNHFSAKRRAKVIDQTPELTEEEALRIRDMYWLAKDLGTVTGETYHVDHIIPLSKGGLHHPDNLQILPADLNLKKGAK